MDFPRFAYLPAPPSWPTGRALEAMFARDSRSLKLKGSRSHLQISLNITKLCKDENYTVMMMYMKSYSWRW